MIRATSDPEGRLRRLEQLLKGHTSRAEEREIVDLLRATDDVELDHILAHLDLVQLVDDVEDHGAGQDYRRQMLDHLTLQRLPEVTVENRGRLVDALQHGRTDEVKEKAAAAILLGTRGADLTALKNAIDDGGDHHDLQQLVFHDIDSEARKQDLLIHFQQQAAAAPSGELKVLSDIDDTFYVNLKDKRYPEKTVYPGVLQYYHELDRGYWSRDGHDGDIAFVTARPGDRMGIVKDRTLRDLHAHGVEDATVLAGNFAGLIGRDRMARGKFANFNEYRALFPEYSYCFTGDSGQADPLFGEMLLANAPDVVRGVFIHDVVATPQPKRDEYRNKGILFFDTYVGAALAAHERGLLNLGAVRRVAAAALDDLARIRFQSAEQRAAREQEFRRDVGRLNALLPPEDRLPTP